MAIGRLYNSSDGQFLAEIDYQCYDDGPQSWWGEFTLTEYRRLSDGDSYTIELEDGRRGRCFLKKKVNRAVYGLSPLFCYRFTGGGILE
jgi:hypothetical protein